MIGLLAGLMVGVGILIALVSGLCGLILLGANGGSSGPDAVWSALMAWSPFVFGLGVALAGLLLLRSARRRRREPKDGDGA